MDKIIILGGGNCQMSAFHLAQQRGLHTVLFDMNHNAPAASIADEFYPVSTYDIEACLEAARQVRTDGRLGVMTLGTDQPVYTAAHIAGELGLPSFIGADTALTVTNKAVMKQALTRHGIPTARYWLADKRQLSGIDAEGQLVIKPLDNQGQKGVLLCGGLDEAIGLFDQSIAFSREERLLVEEYYPSREITASAWVHDGKAHILTVTDRMTYNHTLHIGICAAHRFPSHWAEGSSDEIANIAQQLCGACNITQGPLYIQLLNGASGIIVNELACRIGGAFEDIFIPYLTGFDILSAVIDGAMGEPVTPPLPFDTRDKHVCMLMPYAKQGRLDALTPLERILELPFVKDAAYNFNEGEYIPAFENSGARLAHAVLLAENAANMEHALDTFQRRFYARDANGRDMLLPMEIYGGGKE